MIALPTVPVTPGDAVSGAVTVGRLVAVMVKASTKLLLGPTRLLATSVVLTLPLTVGVPVIAPVLVLSDRPVGRTLGPTTA